ncbi:glucosaminidase domain-containing protein [Cohnella zeiphila]|uniref:Glucosaminidase domain-containing protein n=1 Tax=Cohnella zeiphila TaxID=2761120 RepID=A0A7X0SKE1_9BACL|nr:glucosaminidase domain-containing protein [Cohnella zeiphila]MBB6730424.1 glucosaminidase domain-containing protein [Cohnella zeiphila]
MLNRKSGLIGLYLAAFFAIFVIFGISHASHASAASSSSAPAKLNPASYVTTAYFLNVRADASNRSKIIDVVSKGTVLSVIGQSGSWLRLEGGGYVHGSYADRLDRPVKPPSERTVASIAPAVLSADPPKPARALVIRKPDSKVQTASGLTEEGIKEIFAGTKLEGQGLEKAVLEVEADYGVNAFFTIAVMKLESGNGGSKIARTRNNLFGLNSSNGTGYLRFESKEESVRRFGQLISKNYIGKGYTTIEKIARKYCPANSKWSSLVKNVMKSDYKSSA